MPDELTNREVLQTSNSNFVEPNVLQLRLDTNPTLDRLQRYLQGYDVVFEEVMDKETGQSRIASRIVQFGTSKANSEGVQTIMAWIQNVVNPHFAQGNFTREQYGQFLYRARRDVTRMIVTNCYRWKINDDDLNPIIDFCMNLMEGFASRPIDNKERISYQATVIHQDKGEVKSQESKRGMFSWFKG